MEVKLDGDSAPEVDLADVLGRIAVSTEKRNAAMEAVEMVVGNSGVASISEMLGYLNGPLAETLRKRKEPGEAWKFEPGWLLALELWDAVGRRRGDLEIVEYMVTWTTAIQLGGEDTELRYLHHLANRFAWATRGTGGVPNRRMSALSTDDLLVLYVFAERRRFMFKFAELGDFLRSHEIGTDPTLEASLGLAEIMTGDRSSAVERLERALDLARTQKRSLESSTRDIALHAMWLADGLDGQADYLLEWSGASKSDSNAIVSFRRAKAFRLKGDFDEAMREIQNVFDRIDGNTEFSRTFSEQAIREREIIQAVQLFHRSQLDLEASVREAQADAIDEVRKVYGDSEAKIEELDRNALIRTVEVVTLFTAAVSFAIGGISLASGEGLSGQDRLRLLVGLGTGLLTFAFFIFAAFEFVRNQSSEVSRDPSWGSPAGQTRGKAVFRQLAPVGLVFLALIVVNLVSLRWFL